MKFKQSTEKLLEKVNEFLLEWGKGPVVYLKHIDYYNKTHETFYVKRDLLIVLTESLGKSSSLLKEAREFNYQASPIQTSFLFESQFQLEYHYFLLNNGFNIEEVPDLSTTYTKVITYLKRANRQKDVINVCEAAIRSKACEKYMDYTKEIKLARTRLLKQQEV